MLLSKQDTTRKKEVDKNNMIQLDVGNDSGQYKIEKN